MKETEQKVVVLETGQVARGAFVNLVGNLGKLSHFAFDVIASRALGQSIYGYFSTTWLTMHLCFIVCYFGAHRLVIDYVARHKDHQEDEYYRAIVGCIVVSISLSFLLVIGIHLWADAFAAYLDKPPVAEYMKIVSWSAPFYCLTTILLTATRGIKIMSLWVIVRNAIEPFSDLVILLILFFTLGLLASPFYAKAITFVFGSGWALVFFARHFQLKKLITWPHQGIWKKIVGFGFPVMVADFLSIVILKVDIIPLSILVGTTQVAVFQVVMNISNIMRNIPQAVDPILMPIVVEMRRKGNYEALQHIYSTVIRTSLFFAFGFFVLMSLFGDILMGVYGDSYTVGFAALVITCFGIMLHAVSASVEPALIMSGYPYLNLFNNILFVSINLIMDFLLIPSYGLIGAACASLTAGSTTAVFQMTLLYRVLKVRPISWSYLKVVGFGLVFGIAFKFIEEGLIYLDWSFRGYEIVLSALFVIHYLIIGWRLALTQDDREVFSSVLKRKQRE